MMTPDTTADNAVYVWDGRDKIKVIINEPYEIIVGRFTFTAWRYGLYPSGYTPYIVNLADPVEWEAWQAALDLYQRNERLLHRAKTKAMLNRGVTAPEGERGGFVYLIQSPTGDYKIGRTRNPYDRFETFEVKLPFEVDFEWLIPTGDMYALESQLRKRYADCHVNGEWHSLSPEQVSEIVSIDGDAFDHFPGA